MAEWYPEISPEVWSKKHNLDIKTRKCSNCEKELTADIPWISKDWVGFTSKEHDCGEEYNLVVGTLRNAEERQEMVDLFRDFSEQIEP